MHPSLGSADRVDLVHDHRLDRPQHVASYGRCQDQIQGFRRRDQDIGRLAHHLAAFGLRRVAGAHRGTHIRNLYSMVKRVLPDAAQRGAQVSLDVVVERLEGRYVQGPYPGLPVISLITLDATGELGKQAVQCPQEGGERFSRPGGGVDQGVLAARYGRPRLLLRRRGHTDLFPEPVSDPRQEQPERVVAPSLAV